MAIRYVGALIIQAIEPQRLAEWYETYFDFETTLEHDGGYFGAFDTERGPFHFGIVPVADDNELTTLPNVVITFRVDDFPAVVEVFAEDGFEPLTIAEDEEGRYATYRDPEGNQVSIWGD